MLVRDARTEDGGADVVLACIFQVLDEAIKRPANSDLFKG